MAINLDKQYGPFPLKVWLVIGAGGIGIGLYAASKMNANDTATTGALAVPPQVIFNRVLIGLESVPADPNPIAVLKPADPNPIMPSNPAATPAVLPTIIPQTPVSVMPSNPAATVDYTAVNPSVWNAFINTIPNPAAPSPVTYHTDPNPVYSTPSSGVNTPGLDTSGNAYF